MKKIESNHKELDLRGEVCPDTSQQTKLALDRMKSGECLKVLVDYPPAVESIPRLVKIEGHTTLKVEKVGAHWEIVIQKG
jgi:TusA-related sulfurtransferase